MKHRSVFLCFIRVGVFEETQRDLHAQHMPYCFVHCRFGDLPRVHETWHVIVVKTANHIHIDTGQQGFPGRSCPIVGNTMRD